MADRPTLHLPAALSIIVVASAAAAHASVVPLYAGPGYTAGSGGYQAPTLPYAPGASVASGIGTASATQLDAAGRELGQIGLRWDSQGNAAALTGGAGASTLAFAVNNLGTVAGSATDSTGTRAMRWLPGVSSGTFLGSINLAQIGSSSAYAINAAGMMAGYAERFDAAGNNLGPRAVRWDAAGVATALDTIGLDANGGGAAAGYAINASGTVVGFSTQTSGTFSDHAVRWNAGSTAATELGTLTPSASGGPTNAYAIAVNDAGTAAGYSMKYNASDDASIGNRAVRWDANSTVATELDPLSVDGTGSADSMAYAINAAGTVVGSSRLFSSAGDIVGTRATRWDANSTAITALDGLGGVTYGSEAFAINASGDSVGYVDFANLSGTDRAIHAVLWDASGHAVDLNAMIAAAGWTLTRAVGINDAGWITGIGAYDPDGGGPLGAYDRLFLMQLPEPTTGGAMAAAMLAMALRRRDK